VFLVEDGTLKVIDIGEEFESLAIATLSTREADMLVSRSFVDGEVLIPSDLPPRDTILDPVLWKYWYEVDVGTIALSMTTFVSRISNFMVGIPDEWPEKVIVAELEDDPRRFVFTDVELEEVVLEIKVLEINNEAQPYLDEGFQQIQLASGLNRYYIKTNCSLRDEAYITGHFYSVGTA
jgi:hypothetical protein